MRTHKDLIVWNKSIELVKLIYTETQTSPKEEVFGLTSQMRRASISIPSNIAEGYGRASGKETERFIYIPIGSASELETQIIIAEKLGLLNEAKMSSLIKLRSENYKESTCKFVNF